MMRGRLPGMTLSLATSATLIAVSLLVVPQPARALDFGFGFDGVEGVITGLVDNTDNQQPGSVVLLKNSLGFPAGWPAGFAVTIGGRGFSVRNGLMTSASYSMIVYGFPPLPGGATGLIFEDYPQVVVGTLFWKFSRLFYSDQNGPVVFTPLSSPALVPGPLPLLGAVAAFAFSNRLRKRSRAGRSLSASARLNGD